MHPWMVVVALTGISSAFCIDLDITIKRKEPLAVVDTRFLSVTLGSSMIKNNFSHTDLFSKKFITLAKGLSADIFLRVGGSDADHVRFRPTKNYILNTTELNSLCRFVKNLGWTLIFDLNLLRRRTDGAWDPSNAVQMIGYLKERKFDLHYQLGNEPDLFPRHLNITIPPRQLAKDFENLHSILREVTGGWSKLIGPDVATLTRYNYFEEVLSNMTENSLDAVSFHHYYSSSQHVSVKNFTDIAYLDRFLSYGLQALRIVKRSFSKFPHPPVWIGETSSTYGGGSRILGESYSASFLWLDKLGIAAQMNISVLARQTLKGGYYSLLNKFYDPTPDYWVSVVYKQIVGTKVLDVTGRLQYGRKMRVYAHCMKKSFVQVHGKVVLIFLNLDSTEFVHLRTPACHSKGSVTGFMYLFEPANGRLDDKQVKLNGKLLRMIDEETLPKLSPVSVPCPYYIPPLTLGFLLLDKDFDISFQRMSICDA